MSGFSTIIHKFPTNFDQYYWVMQKPPTDILISNENFVSNINILFDLKSISKIPDQADPTIAYKRLKSQSFY